jgi:hypothetical protein
MIETSEESGLALFDVFTTENQCNNETPGC